MSDTKHLGLQTGLVHCGQRDPDGRRNMAVGIHQTSAFTLPDVPTAINTISQATNGYFYGRYDHPNSRLLEQKLAFLDDAEDCAVAPNGMAAFLLLILSLVPSGQAIVADKHMYHEIHEMFEALILSTGHPLTLVDFRDFEALSKALVPETGLVVLETPTNPLQYVLDIEEVGKLTRRLAPKAVYCVDNTMLTPLHQKCLQLGADVTLYSTTKHLAGHGDAMGGAICGRKTTIDKIRGFRNLSGLGLAPFEAWLTVRGIKSLPLRLAKQCRTTEAIVEFLNQHPMVQRVYYSTLREHARPGLIERQQRSGGSVLVFEVRGDRHMARRLLESVRIFSIETTFGNLESTMYHFQTFANPARDLSLLGENERMIRISIGVEDTQDLINDLAQALEIAANG